MPPRHRRPVGPIRGRARRTTEWVTTLVNVSSVATGTTTWTDLLGPVEVAGTSHVGLTIMRPRLTGSASFSTTSALPVGFWDVGLIVEDVNQGASGDMMSKTGIDWHLLTRIYPQGNGQAYNEIQNFVLEPNTKRRCHRIGQSYWLATKNETGVTASLSCIARVLVALP